MTTTFAEFFGTHVQKLRIGANGQAMGLCSLHEDRNASFSCNTESGLWKCHGCGESGNAYQLAKKLGVEPPEDCEQKEPLREVAQYDYTDAAGNPVMQVRRYTPKTFRQFRWEGGEWKPRLNGTRPILYNLQEISKAKGTILVEGEKDCESLKRWKLLATTNPMGAGKWNDSYSDALQGKAVVIIPDTDEAGLTHGRQVAVSLWGKAERTRFVLLPQGKDVTEWRELGGTKEQLIELIKSTPVLKQEDIDRFRLELQTPKLSDKPPEEWPDPQPIQCELRVVDPLPADIIPEPFRNWIADIAHRMQCPIDFVAIPAIVLTGAIIGAGCGIRPKKNDDWLVVPNLWGGIVGRPGKLKTPAIAEPLQMLERLAAKAKEEIDSALRDYEADFAIYEAKKNAFKEELKVIAKGNVKRPVESVRADLVTLEPPKKPVWNRYKTNDATIAKMSELLAENPRGMLLFRDELIGLLATWDQEGHEPDRAFYLEAWNGFGTIDTDRIGRGTIHTENLCVSVLGGIQPGKLLAYLYRAIRGLENDGLIQRLQLLVYPDDPSDWNLIDCLPNTDARRQAFEIIEKLSQMDFTKHGAVLNDGDKIPYFRFSDDAQKLSYEFLTELEREKLKSNDEPIILEHLSKYRSLMPSLALIFHLIEVAAGKASGPVTLRAAELAAAWCDYLESHARRIYGLVGDITTQASARLSQKIKKGALEDGFTVRDVYRKEWSLLHEKDVVEAACDELVKEGWLREDVIPPVRGQRGKTLYRINPKIRGSHG